MEIKVDKSIYSDSCITKVIYHMSDEYSFSRRSNQGYEVIEVAEKTEQKFDENRFWDELNDFKLREQINLETKDIKTILFAKAFGDFDNLKEEDFEKII